ncbi:MAG TPA: hypothetical protein PKD16_14710 [Saprospiraceae bacterium]|jgi:hypothetical protein|nr:hypothetical protein [Saprospiraceae bacterium]
MNITQIQENVEKVVSNSDRTRFVYNLLLAYGLPKTTISRLEQGGMNLSKDEGEVIHKKKLYYKMVSNGDVVKMYDAIHSDAKVAKHNPRFILVTDGSHLRALDTKTKDVLDIAVQELTKHFDFFLPWAGMEKFEGKEETIADVKAADKMAKFYDEISKDNPTGTEAEVHSLNVFLSRMLFCFFAEDTGIFEPGQFTGAISSHTQEDGSDLHTYLDTLWDVMNTDKGQRQNLPAYLDAFPYVNGGLFRHQYAAPMFTRRSRQMAIDMGELDWKAINPDIFGSMIQAVITPEHRGGLGMHYTSVPNIMKVIEPLFLNELYEAYESAKGNLKKLNELRLRISKIKIFDPACGSGNFLIIAYKELRKLEMLIISDIQALRGHQGSGSLDLGTEYLSMITLSHFYGIELDDFAHEVAILSLWLAEHQMNQAFFAAFGMSRPALPLMETGHIVHGNACRVDWEVVCPKEKDDEIYILGNPPYKGSSGQNAEQKQDMVIVFEGFSGFKNLDFIAIWFYKGAKYIINSNARCSFVSTNSICQGEQVALLWPSIINLNIEIDFAYTSFKWSNNAKDNAGVAVIIVCLRNLSYSRTKYLYYKDRRQVVNNISPYLTQSKNQIVSRRSKMLSLLPEMTYGNKAVYGEPLILNEIEKEFLIKENKDVAKYIKKFIGAKELLDGIQRWVIWIRNNELVHALTDLNLKNRVEYVKQLRLGSNEKGANELAKRSHQFRDTFETTSHSVIIPLTTSERREFLPIGISNTDEILSNAVSVIYDAELWIFALISSKMHILWVKTVCGSLETRIRYSNILGYNTFPFPPITDPQKQELEKHVYRILEEREKHSEKTLAQLYDPDKMPQGLRDAHRENDLAIERCYRSKPFESDEERLEYLFKMYEQMIKEEKNKGTLFATERKPKKNKK